MGDRGPRVIVALDCADRDAALAIVSRLDPGLCRLKIGKELFTATGPALISELVDLGYGVFLDLKFHDIPNTVAGACRAAAELGVWMLNVHASGGPAMLEAARAAVPAGGPLLIAVTVLTSLSSADLAAIGMVADPDAQVGRLAGLARQAGLDGVVCSPREAAQLRRQQGPGWLLVTPGVRPASAAGDDQRRVMTPRDAILAGADYLVIGRPVTKSDNPRRQLLTINSEIASIAPG